jgi:hypothetical protein
MVQQYGAFSEFNKNNFSKMRLKDWAKQLANRINQAHYIEDVLNRAVRSGFKLGNDKTWIDPKVSGFPPIGTMCAIRKNGDTMIGILTDIDEWDDWSVNGENEDCVDSYFILPI